VENGKGPSMEATPAAVEIGHEWCRMAVRSQNGRTEVILDRSNERATPAVVARKDGEWIIGSTAIDLGARNPDVALADPVRLFASASSVSLGGEVFTPEEILAALLARLREDSFRRLGREIREVVIAVPSDVLKETYGRIQNAAESAGWKVLKIVPDCVSAVADCNSPPSGEGSVFLVIHPCNECFNVSLLKILGGEIVLRANVSEPGSGVSRFREAIVSRVLEKVRRKYGVDGSIQPRFMIMLRRHAELAMREFETGESACVVVIGALKGSQGDVIDLEMDLSMEEFAHLAETPITAAIAAVDCAISNAGLDQHDVGRVMFIGNTTGLVPLKRRIVEKFGNRMLPITGPDESVVRGAARMAAAREKEPEDRVVKTVTAKQETPPADTNPNVPSEQGDGDPCMAASTPGGGADSGEPPPEADQCERLRFGSYRRLRFLREDTHYALYTGDTESGHPVWIRSYSRKEERGMRAFSRALTACHLKHPNIEEIFDIGSAGDLLFLVFDAKERQTLREHLRSGGRRRTLPLKQSIETIIAICEALRTAHDFGVIHRNVKPDNVILGPHEHDVRLTGFDVCALLPLEGHVRSRVGTLPYMAPEAIKGKMGRPADLYAAAVVLYEMATGRHPFVDSTPEGIKARILNDTPPSPMEIIPGFPRELSELLICGLEKDPSRRVFRSEDLRAMLSGGMLG